MDCRSLTNPDKDWPDKVHRWRSHGRAARKRYRVNCFQLYLKTEKRERAKVYEIFRVRLETPPAEVFLLPDLTVCQTSHTPEIPTMSARAWHSKLEIKDYIYGMGSEIFTVEKNNSIILNFWTNPKYGSESLSASSSFVILYSSKLKFNPNPNPNPNPNCIRFGSVNLLEKCSFVRCLFSKFIIKKSDEEH